jgi:hypothetical protein
MCCVHGAASAMRCQLTQTRQKTRVRVRTHLQVSCPFRPAHPVIRADTAATQGTPSRLTRTVQPHRASDQRGKICHRTKGRDLAPGCVRDSNGRDKYVCSHSLMVHKAATGAALANNLRRPRCAHNCAVQATVTNDAHRVEHVCSGTRCCAAAVIAIAKLQAA